MAEQQMVDMRWKLELRLEARPADRRTLVRLAAVLFELGTRSPRDVELWAAAAARAERATTLGADTPSVSRSLEHPPRALWRLHVPERSSNMFRPSRHLLIDSHLSGSYFSKWARDARSVLL